LQKGWFRVTKKVVLIVFSNTNVCFANTFFCDRVTGGPDVYIIKDHTNLSAPQCQVNVQARTCCNFIREYKYPCRHVLKVARVEGWLTTTANRDAFFAYWCAQEYWVSNYKQGYSAHQITLPVENLGTFKPDKDYNDEVGEIRLQPPGDRKAPTVGHHRKKRHKSKGEEGTTRRSKKKKKAADAGGEDTEDDTDGATLDELLFGSLEEQIQDDGDISEDNAPAIHDFEQPLETAAEPQLRETDAIAGDDGSVHSAGTEKGL
jgi:hypothetical protein